MSQYHKIPAVFRRPSDNPKFITLWDWYTEELNALKDVPIWSITEKIDGTNIRVIWNGDKIEFRGKTDNANIPPRLLERLKEVFAYSEEQFEQEWGDTEVIFYGEGFGSKIQKGGGDYFPESQEGQNEFALFDVMIGGVWLDNNSVVDIATKFNLEYVHEIQTNRTLTDIVNMIINHVKEDYQFESEWGGKPAEGFVCRTNPQLLDKRGKRIITKVKYDDFIAIKDKGEL